MHSPRAVIVAMLIAAATFPVTALSADATQPAIFSKPAQLFTLVNVTFDSVTALAIAPAKSNAFENIVLGEPLQGGLTSTTVHVPAGGCLRDVRATFRDGHSQVFPAVDVCRYHSMRLTSRGA
ncbi:hypothetical protein EC912_101707 [Luteibacter rhizovicinus]|uniref:Plastocyanin n=1 Tax=Luteibacter rhizovicinus TaxID=242606 RepID=A0A4R3YYG2_9GAMM|nr:hypothetical protein [Luteibacter rhizovicinus]TCV97690.1 hypothetical protein EC912_101707 [Luteibacter rhizovicinus]